MDDAMQFGHDVVVSVLQEYQRVFTDYTACGTDEPKTALDTLKSVV